MKKRLLVDLSSLKNLNSGLGQVAMNYGNYFMKNYHPDTSSYVLTLLLPKQFIGVFGNKIKYISSSFFLRKHCQLLFPKYDIWHSIHQLSRYYPIYSSTIQILTVHDLNYLYEKSGKSRNRNHRSIQRKIERADMIICISQFTKREVESKLQLNGKECSVVYNKVDLLDNNLAMKPPFVLNESFFFTLGVITPKKNFHVLLDLMKLIPEKQLYIVGHNGDNTSNPYTAIIQERIEEEHISNVSLHGPISHEEKIWMYQHCEAFLFPSLFEGFGMPLIEAMQFGKPVFSSKESSLKEIGSTFAFFWDNFDPVSMKQVINSGLCKFYETEDLAEMEVKYAHQFSTDHHFQEYEKIYATI